MSGPQFDKLPLAKKIELLELNGVYLELYRYELNYKVALFNISGLYIEVYLKLPDNAIELIKALHNYKELDKWIEGISLVT